MPKFETVRPVEHAPEQMFDLVADVERYPEFLPLCERLEVRSEQERDGKRLLIADMTVAYKMVRETFASQVLLKPQDREIDVKYIEGPFRYLDNRWTFEPREGGGTNVRFFIDYEFKSRMLGMLMGSMFDYAFRRFAQAFEERANKVYGRASALPAA
ncbi:ubiquinone-binding protein [Aureimonas endophytica]|uniref:Ubiquinone-binding protein n=1 Tax=Aureimonas endophytica TaxID=2027858 RepID=A0A917E1H2_9HYPH|nr:type II toxin-antitoxin system RatA family toxin [Aureimonas endophytica]GGD89188.1 ubiquinone-binding protein [Aureimonas endophytica]